jgi:predicted transcriptional regulator
MNCSTLKSKYELHKSLVEEYDIPKKSKELLKKTNQTIGQQMKEKKCIESRDGDKVYNYKDLLDSMTYEQCGYNMYLYYYEQNADNNI